MSFTSHDAARSIHQAVAVDKEIMFMEERLRARTRGRVFSRVPLSLSLVTPFLVYPFPLSS
eukprot:3795462-Pyramimonas_sp.AAC.1